MNYMNNTNNAILSYTDYELNERKMKQFSIPKIKQQSVKLLVQLAKYLTIPSIYKNNFQEFCNPQLKSRQTNEDEMLDSTQQSICIFLIEPFEKSLLSKTQSFLHYHLETLTEKVREKSQSIFEIYSSFQFVKIDLNFQWKFKKLVNLAFTKEKDMKKYVAFALYPDNNKITFLEDEKFFDDWVDSLFAGEKTVPFFNRILYEFLERTLFK